MSHVAARGLFLVVLGVSYPADSMQPQGSRLWRPEERVVLTDFRRVDAVAVDDAVAYAVTRHGIAVYDHRFRRWEPPLTAAHGWDAAEWTRVFDAAADASDRSLWLATDRGVSNYQPALQRLETVIVPGGASQLWLDPADPFAGVYFRDRTGWHMLPRGGVIPVPAPRQPAAGRRRLAARLAALVERYPIIATLSARVLTDQRMRSYRFTAAAEVPVTGEVFLGTNGLGLVEFDPGISDFEVLPFGLLTQGATALALTTDGVWAGGSDIAGDPGVTFAANDLARFEYYEGPRVRGFAGSAIYDLLAVGEELWLATDAGIAVFNRQRDSRRITSSDGLPSERVYAFAAAPDGVWVGTDRGLALITAGDVERVGDPHTVWDLASTGDSVWLARAAGCGGCPGVERRDNGG